MPHGLKDSEIQKLQDLFATNEHVEQVILYGSRAKGTHKPFSDVDITLVGENLTDADLKKLSLAIDDLLLPYIFDISLFSTLKNDDLIDHVRQNGITLYQKKIEWKEYKLGKVAINITSGGTPKSSEERYYGGSIPWLNTKEINFNRIVKTEKYITEEGLKNSSAKWIPAKSVIVAMYGATAGKVAYSLIDLTTNQACCNLSFNEASVDSLFVYYYLQNSYVELENLACGAAQQNLSVGVISDFSIWLPPLSEQKRIASILSSLDDKIDLLHRENATLEAMAETLFRHHFIDNPNPDWKEGKLGDEFEFTMGQSPAGDSFNEDGIGMPMYQGNADFGFRFPTKRVFTTRPTRLAKANDTLISVRAPVGTQNMATEECCIGRGVAAFRYRENPSFYSYTYYKLRALLEIIKQFDDNGTVFGSISKSDFENIDILIPSEGEIVSFQNQSKAIDDKIINNNRQIQTLTRMRDRLLQKLMTNGVL